MTSFLTITLFIVAAHGAVLPPKISEDVLVKGFPVFKLDLDRNEDVRMMTLPEIMKDAGKLVNMHFQCVYENNFSGKNKNDYACNQRFLISTQV